MSFCEMSNTLPSGSWVVMPANGRLDGPLEPLHGRIVLAHAVEHGLGVLDLDAEMVEAGGAPGPPRIDVEADIAVATVTAEAERLAPEDFMPNMAS